MKCNRCGSDKVIKHDVEFSNGTKHTKVICVSCGGFIKFVPRANDLSEEIALNDPRFREYSRAQLIIKILDLEKNNEISF